MNLQCCIDSLLISATADVISASNLASMAGSAGGARTNEERREVSLEAIRHVVDAGLMEIGDMREDGFHKWDAPPDEALARVASEWRAFNRHPWPGEICWLHSTSKGLCVGKRIEKERGEEVARENERPKE